LIKSLLSDFVDITSNDHKTICGILRSIFIFVISVITTYEQRITFSRLLTERTFFSTFIKKNLKLNQKFEMFLIIYQKS